MRPEKKIAGGLSSNFSHKIFQICEVVCMCVCIDLFNVGQVYIDANKKHLVL